MLMTFLQAFFLPRRMAAGMAMLLVLATASLLLALHLSEKSVLGHVRAVVSLGNGHSFLRVQFPLDGATTPIVVADDVVEGRNISPGTWVLAFGEIKMVDERQLFVANALATYASPLPWTVGAAGWERWLREAPLPAILLGCLSLVAGGLIVAVATGALLAGMSMVLTWHAVHAAAFAGLISQPPGVSMYPLVATGAFTGLVLGWRSARQMGSVWQRLMAVTALYLMLPYAAERFAWPELVSWALLIASAALPVLAHALIGAYLLAIGLDAQKEAVWAIVAISAGVAMTAQGWTAVPFRTSPFAMRSPHSHGV